MEDKIAENLAKIIESTGKTNIEFAKELGINRTTLYLYLTGKRTIPTKLLYLIYEKYGVNPNEVLGVKC